MKKVPQKFVFLKKKIYLCIVTYLKKLRHHCSFDESNFEDRGAVTQESQSAESD